MPINDRVLRASGIVSDSAFLVIQFALPFMILYPTDCLAIGYFARNASNQLTEYVPFSLNLMSCLMRAKEVKALFYEVCKPAKYHNIDLNLRYVMITKEGLKAIRSSLISQSALYGLGVTYGYIEDLCFAMKCFIEGLQNNRYTVDLAIHDILYPVPPLTHHFVLLLCYCPYLRSLNLGGSKGLFKNPNALPLFCEALKYATSLNRLWLDGCDIDDRMLQMLTPFLISTPKKCLLNSLDIGWNLYTSDGLTRFLTTLISGVRLTALVLLSTHVVNDDHRALVERFNTERQKYYPDSIDLRIGCKNDNWQEVASSMNYLWTKPQLLKRDSHT